ncbi:Uncharacterised protein [Segatella copri]|nr:Uncharacterised protein [Segatella copri]
MVLADIIDVFVDFICQHKYFRMLLEYFCQCSQFFLRVYATGRVAWRTENEHLGLLCNSILQLLCCHLKVLVETGIHNDRSTSCQFHHLWVAYPIWCRNDNLVAWIYECQYSVADALLTTSTNDYFIDSVLQTILVL